MKLGQLHILFQNKYPLPESDPESDPESEPESETDPELSQEDEISKKQKTNGNA